MFKLVLEKTEDPEIKLPTSAGSWKKQESSRKTSISALLTDCFIDLYILKEISPGISLQGMMVKLKLLYFGHLMRRADSLEKTLMLGGIEGRGKRGRQRMRWLDGITDSMDVRIGL